MLNCISICLIVAHLIQSSQTLQCYSCSEEAECGKLFSRKSPNVNIVKSRPNDLIVSCSISVSPEGLTTRDLVPSYKCRSSSNEFCCNEDLCNHLPSPPLPALTSLKCGIGKCFRSSGLCIYDTAHVTILSSATESCSVTFGHESSRYYRKGCQPTIQEPNSLIKSSSPILQALFCCNSPECNTGHIESAVKGSALQCYTCDSRITGLEGCMVLNKSSPHVYKAGSSSNDESCATIIGLEGIDSTTGITYPVFAMRTFIPNCVSKQLGYVSYGGAYFKGRIECCSTRYCNTHTLNATTDKLTVKKLSKRKLISIGLVAGGVLTIFITTGAIIGLTIYRRRQKTDKRKYDPCSTSEPPILLESLKERMKKPSSQQPTTDSYPEPCATP